MTPHPPRPSLARAVGSHEQRIRALERRTGFTGDDVRHVYGRVYDDGSILWEGSGDWDALWTSDGMVLTFDPAFTVGFVCNATPNDNEDFSYLEPPVLQPVPVGGLSMSGFVLVNQIDLGTVRIVFWDLDGNPMMNRCGFDFQAVGA